MNLFINDLSSEDVLTSYNFARNSDVVFSETVTHQEFDKLNKNNDLEIIFQNSYLVFYVQKKFELSENNIIFTNTYFIDNLFEILKEVEHFKNIKLITHQTDIPITEKVFKTKPDCISEWYSINVDFDHKNLIPIPLGLANYYSPKNAFKENFQKFNINKNPELKLYMNYKINTNVHYMPIHLQPYFKKLGFKKNQFPLSEKYGEEALSLPIYPYLDKKTIDFIIKKIFKILK